MKHKSIYNSDGKIRPSVRKKCADRKLRSEELHKYLDRIYVDKSYDEYILIGLTNSYQDITTAVYNRSDNMKYQSLILYKNRSVVVTVSPCIFYDIVDKYLATFEQTETEA